MVKRAVQVLPYMRFAKDDPDLSRLLCGVVRRQAYSVALNPYANAFNYNNSKHTISLPLQATSSLKVDLHPCPTILGHGCTMTYPCENYLFVLLPSGGAGHQDDQTLPNMTAGVFEAKYELDSLAGTLVGPYTYL